MDETSNRVREHDSGEVVPGKEQRLLDRAGRDDDPLGPEAVEDIAGVDRYEPTLVDPEGSGRRQHFDGWIYAQGSPIETVIDEDDLPSLCRGRLRGMKAGLAAADHEQLGSAVLGVEAP